MVGGGGRGPLARAVVVIVVEGKINGCSGHESTSGAVPPGDAHPRRHRPALPDEARPGATARVTGEDPGILPSDSLSLPSPPLTPSLAAGGAGVTPCLAAVRTLLGGGDAEEDEGEDEDEGVGPDPSGPSPPRRVGLLYAARGLNDLAWREELEATAARHPPGRLSLSFHAEEMDEEGDEERGHPRVRRGRPTAADVRATLERLVAGGVGGEVTPPPTLPVARVRAHLYGSRGFVRAVRTALVAAGVPPGRVLGESWGG